MTRRQLVSFASLSFLFAFSVPAIAYRPFDGTDADVAAAREFELELGPVGYHREGSERQLVMPSLVLNYGLFPGFEAVLEGRNAWLLSRHPVRPSVEDAALSIKSLLRAGSLQDGRGLSVALETGLLLAGTEEAFGVHVASIISQRFPALTWHLNLTNDFRVAMRYEASASLIVEGPEVWPVRPVAEGMFARDFGDPELRTGLAESVLVGAIAPCSKALSFDLALRYGQVERLRDEELRLGLTWSVDTR